MRSEQAIRRDEADDVMATVTLRLVRKLQGVVEDEIIRDFEGYVATLTYRTIYDFMRERFPERMRLKNRLRYLLTHEPRFALWNTDAGLLCGLREWEGRGDPLDTFSVSAGMASRAMFDQQRPHDAVFEIFERAGRPLLLETLVRIAAELWGITEVRIATEDEHLTVPAQTHAVRYEARQFVCALWDEIRLLPQNQRAALLLNLRDPDGTNAVALIVVLGVAGLDEIARVMGLARDELIALWDKLPLDDLTIAERLGLTRQQVINLRRSARERLTRRTRMQQREGRRGG